MFPLEALPLIQIFTTKHGKFKAEILVSSHIFLGTVVRTHGCTPGRQKQKYCHEFKASQIYVVSSRQGYKQKTPISQHFCQNGIFKGCSYHITF